jgi:hypothetical protein
LPGRQRSGAALRSDQWRTLEDQLSNGRGKHFTHVIREAAAILGHIDEIAVDSDRDAGTLTVVALAVCEGERRTSIGAQETRRAVTATVDDDTWSRQECRKPRFLLRDSWVVP